MATKILNTNSITITKLHTHVGAEICGVDLSHPLDTETLFVIKQAWVENSLLLFSQCLKHDFSFIELMYRKSSLLRSSPKGCFKWRETV